MKWKTPPNIKIYEALSAVADGRVEIHGTSARVRSTSGNKRYDVAYDPDRHAITSNDNGSYYRGYLGYPAIAFLMQTGVLTYDATLGDVLKGVHWKDVNTKFKNDYEKTLDAVLVDVSGETCAALTAYTKEMQEHIARLGLTRFETREPPPKGY